MSFTVRAKNNQGLTRLFSREAESRAELLTELRAEGCLVLEVKEEKVKSPLPPWYSLSWLLPMSGFDVEMGLRQLASMLKSGVTLLAAVNTVAEQSLKPRAVRCWLDIASAIYRGESFAAALGHESGRFDEIVVRLAEVGERSGELEHAMTRAADQLEARRNLRTQVINALMYPCLAVMMAVGVSAYLVIAVIPKIAEFLESGGAQLPEMTKMLMDFSAWVQANGLSILLYLIAAAAAWFVVRLNAKGREYEDVFLMKIPITGHILRLSGSALFARSVEIMTESGVTLLDTLKTSARLLANRRLRLRVEYAHDFVMKGGTLADSLKGAKEFTPMLRKMAAIGEVTGSLPEAFGETARFHEMLLAIAVRRFGMMIEPVMIVITGLIVGFVYIAFFMALFSIANVG